MHLRAVIAARLLHTESRFSSSRISFIGSPFIGNETGERTRSLSTSLRHFSSAFNVEPPRQHDQVDRVGCAHRAQRHGHRPSRAAG